MELNTAGRSDSLLPAPGSCVVRRTRIRPPIDVVKLEERVRLLLQPPLESLLAAKSLRFTFPPFAYQLDGVAFLYPRYKAVFFFSSRRRHTRFDCDWSSDVCSSD